MNSVSPHVNSIVGHLRLKFDRLLLQYEITIQVQDIANFNASGNYRNVAGYGAGCPR